jgi:hypothetical protein
MGSSHPRSAERRSVRGPERSRATKGEGAVLPPLPRAHPVSARFAFRSRAVHKRVLNRSVVESWPCGRCAHPKPDSHRRRESAAKAGSGDWLRLRGRCTTCAAVVGRRTVAPSTMPDRPGYRPLLCARIQQGNGKVENDDKHQARRGGAQAPRARSRLRRPEVARNRRPTAAQCHPTRCEPQQREPLCSTRPPLRLPHAFARLTGRRLASDDDGEATRRPRRRGAGLA